MKIWKKKKLENNRKEKDTRAQICKYVPPSARERRKQSLESKGTKARNAVSQDFQDE